MSSYQKINIAIINSVPCEILCVLCGKTHITAKCAKYNRKVRKDNFEIK